MNRLTEYQQRYQKLHDGSDAFMDKNGNLRKSKDLFDGSNFYDKLFKHLDRFQKQMDHGFTVLDYGAGKAKHLYKPYIKEKTLFEYFDGRLQAYWCWDPGFALYAQNKPPAGTKFDFVVCADVMEHIPEEYVGEVLSELACYLKDDGIAMMSISGQTAFKSFADGENLHCTVRDEDWWTQKIEQNFGGKKYIMVHTTNKTSTTTGRV